MAIAHSEPDIIAITEVIPKAQLYPITAATLQLTGYDLFTNFELNTPNPGTGGIRGIVFYTKANIQAKELHFKKVSIEHLWLTIKLKHQDSLVLGCIYRSPSSNSTTSTEAVGDLLREVVNTLPSHLVITGDFNYSDINWTNWCLSDSLYSPSQHFIETLQDCYLFQHVTEPTRFRTGHSPHILDLILTNEGGMISELQHLPGLWKSDHICLVFNLNLYATAPPAPTPRLNYNRGNYPEICDGLNQLAWDSALLDKPFKEAWDDFERVLTFLVNDNIPLAKITAGRKNNLPTMHYLFDGQPLESIDITEANMNKKLRDLLPNKTPGPDGWHPRVLKETAAALAKPLHILFQKSLETGELPPAWKEGHITPIHKKGSKRTPGNFRPVSLTSIFSKVIESLIRDNIVNHMMTNDLFADEQHGFVPGRSCVTQLLVVLEEWTAYVEDRVNVDAIYLDFSKAFDSVPHERLLIKLAAYGIRGNILHWIRQFLSNRKQRVVINGQKSTWADVASGIPQGSVLGPILFVIFINDLPSVLQSTARIFADDTKVYRPLITPADTLILQNDIANLLEWSKTWQLSFNESKCKILHLGTTNQKQDYYMNGTTLESMEKERDLGIIIDNRLKFHEHAAATISKANQILAVIKKTFISLDSLTLPLLYKSLVRPHIEYGNSIWGPHYLLDAKAVERVQRRATKLVKTMKDLPYTDRLKYLNIPSLYYRRRRGDMIQVYKILYNIDRINSNKFFQVIANRSTRGHHLKLFKPFSSKDCRRKFFSQRVVEDWNSLPAEVVSAKSLNSFKNILDIHWQNDIYSIPD